MRKKKGKSTVQLIIDALMTGQPLKSKDIARMIYDETGKDVKIQDIASMLSRISNIDKCDLGYFIQRKLEGNSYVYSIVDEVLEFPDEKVYGLTLKTGDRRYSMAQAVKDFPELEKYVDEARSKIKRRKPSDKNIKKPVKPVKKKSGRTKKGKSLDIGETSDILILDDLEKLKAKLKELHGKDIDIKDVEVKISFKFKDRS